MAISLAFCPPCLSSFIIYKILGLDSLHNHHSDINSQHNSNFVEGQPYFLLLVWFICDCVALVCVCAHWLHLPSSPPCLAACLVENWAFMPLSKALTNQHHSSAVFLEWSHVSTTESEKEGTLTQERGKPAFPESCAPLTSVHQAKIPGQPGFLAWAGGSLRARVQQGIRKSLEPDFSSKPSGTLSSWNASFLLVNTRIRVREV